MAASAVLKTLEQAWKTLEPLHFPMAIMGGLALSAWKYPRATRDVDLLIGIGTHEPDELFGCLSTAGFTAKHVPAIRQLGNMRIVQMEFEPPDAFVSIATDLLLVDSEYHREALRRRIPLRLENIAADLFVLACEDLLLHKLIAGRMIDRSDAAAVLRANRDVLDVSYLTEWAARLNLSADLREIWREAFGQEGPFISGPCSTV